ncbi:hypothetical protein B0A50_04695 [Salinomyces thailandicus]|uniref:Ubiquitin-like domain-containing protein n=1 Tax=Salinomyces thailandicus TaxID=706561 RepID=A0A4U0TWB8_9PEZI|nr:hypothetical protein B0A50_04695 [Salinomyces thailandica]
MPPPAPPTDITLRVKVPPGHLEGGADSFDLGIVSVTANIGTIRRRIEEVAPGNPTPDRQRLLYGGRALVDNEQTVADALNTKRDPTQTEYVLHLLVKSVEGLGQNQSAASTATSTYGHGRGAGSLGPDPLTQHGQAPLTGTATRAGVMPGMQMPAGAALPGMPLPMQMPPGGMRVGAGMPGFGQAIAHGQQQRAAMGMHGVGGQPQPQPQPQGQPQQPHAPNGQQATDGQNEHVNSQPPPPGQQPLPQPGVHRPVSGQGYHLEGVGPNGQRFQVHHQTIQFPHPQHGQQQAFQAPGLPFGLPGMMPQAPGLHFPHQIPAHPGMQPQHLSATPGQTPQPGRSALDQARDNMVEMRRMLDEMRTASGENASEEERRRIDDLQQRMQSVNRYIDPLNLHNVPRGAGANHLAGGNEGRASAPPNPTANPQSASLFNHPAPPPVFRPRAPLFPPQQAQFASTLGPRPHPSSNDVTCYLLSSPHGPQSLLFDPQHGSYVGGPNANQQRQLTSLRPSHQHPEADPVAAMAAAQVADVQARLAAGPPQQEPLQAQAQAQAQAQQQPAAPDPLAGPLGQLLNHLWLLLRILIFAYFLLGSSLGWRRPALLVLLGLGFWFVRMGVLNEGGAVRAWWNGIVGAQQQQQQQREQPPGQGAGRRGEGMPAPEAVARRLLEERRERDEGWLRGVVRPVERAVALFLGSLWPGVGEAAVRAREEEERRVLAAAAAAEEAERARREEEAERAKREQDEKASEREVGEREKEGSKETPSEMNARALTTAEERSEGSSS